MRDIKFRAWDGERMHRMTDGPAHSFKIYSDGSGGLGNYGGEPYVHFHAGTDSNPVMQYTGLRDKNGVEIYEGDIVTWSQGIARVTSPVKFSENNYGGWVPFIGFSQIPMPFPEDVEVIGNIYENPELVAE